MLKCFFLFLLILFLIEIAMIGKDNKRFIKYCRDRVFSHSATFRNAPGFTEVEKILRMSPLPLLWKKPMRPSSWVAGHFDGCEFQLILFYIGLGRTPST